MEPPLGGGAEGSRKGREGAHAASGEHPSTPRPHRITSPSSHAPVLMFHHLTDTVSVSPQLTAEDVREAASLGYGTIVCNRPDGEEAGQPSAAEIEAEAQGAGLSFLHLPFSGAGMTEADVDAMTAAMQAPGKLLAYCRSGTRSAGLWAMAATRDGLGADEAIGAAEAAGYDLSGLRPRLG